MKTDNRNSSTRGRWSGRIATTVLICLLGMPAVSGENEVEHMAPIVIQPQKSATLPEMMTKLRSERLIYVGETHTAFADHLVQLDVLRGMAARPEGLAIGVEWFQARFQPVLDAYLAGEIDEADMLKQSEYYDRWRFDYRLYRPIVQFAKDKGIPIIALNASAELTSGIRRLGINELPAELRDQLPDSYDVSDKVYEASLREVFELHRRNGDDAEFQRFVEVQLTWDETMAQHVAEYLTADPAGRMLVLAGKGHVAGRSGIPNRVTRRTGMRGVTIGSYDPASRHFAGADYLVLVPDQALPPAGLMRVLLDTRDEGVFVKGFTPHSPAKVAGVEKGDRLLTINDVPIRHFADVKIAMIDQRPGDEISVTLQRDSLLRGERTVSYTIELAGDS